MESLLIMLENIMIFVVLAVPGYLLVRSGWLSSRRGTGCWAAWCDKSYKKRLGNSWEMSLFSCADVWYPYETEFGLGETNRQRKVCLMMGKRERCTTHASMAQTFCLGSFRHCVY